MNANWCIYWVDKVPAVRIPQRYAVTGEVGEIHFMDYTDVEQCSKEAVKMAEEYPDRQIRVGRIAELDWHP